LNLESITAPTLIFHGTKDMTVPIDYASRAADRIPNARLVEMEGKDHFVFWTPYADSINREIVRFVDTKE